MYYRPTKIDFEGLKFLIMSAPVDSIMKQTIKVSVCFGYKFVGLEALQLRYTRQNM